MSDGPSLPAGVTAITEELVSSLGEIAGLRFPPERLPAITARLRELHTLARAVEEMNLGEAAPASRYDPAWPETPR